MPVSLELLGERIQGSNQEHILAYWNELNEKERENLFNQVSQIPSFTHLNTVLADSLALLDRGKGLDASTKSVHPPPEHCIFNATKSENNKEQVRYQEKGLHLITEGRVAVLLMAGGSGTRLGLSKPKGMFVCPLLQQKKSLFQLHCEKLLRVQHLAKENSAQHQSIDDAQCKVPFLVMTSEQNNKDTILFFEENSFFGLDRNQVHFFIQNSLPCYDEKSRKILMESKSSLCLAPGGNGGVYHSLSTSGLLSFLKDSGVQYVQIFGVDNLLAPVADPIFFGYAAEKRKGVAVKTTAKIAPDEKVGVYALVEGKWGVIEYTEIGEARAKARNPANNELMFNCANIAFHVCSISFLQSAAEKMKHETHFHAARKSIVTMNGKADAVKLEAFIFDMFAWCDEFAGEKENNKDSFGIVQVERTEEFAPIKNGDSSPTDNPTTAARLLQQLHTKRVKVALQGISPSSPLRPDAERALKRIQEGEVTVEISPLISFRDEGLWEIQKDIISSVLQAQKGAIVLLEYKKHTLSKC